MAREGILILAEYGIWKNVHIPFLMHAVEDNLILPSIFHSLQYPMKVDH